MFFSVRDNMADKSNKPAPLVGIKPVPMKLFATWEVDRTPPNCIPRLCSLTLSRLVIFKPLGSDLTSLIIAVKMQGSKRTLRSNEMVLPPNGLLDTELQLNFSLQYPHFLKRDGNKLHIMLQRRKRYKNRTILGYKTLADGIINMSQVLQRQMDLELDLVNDTKTDVKSLNTINNVVARVSVQSLNSQPVDHEDSTKHSQHTGRVADFSDDDEEFSSNEEGEAEGSDSEPMLEERRARKAKIPVNARQRNLKQKFISLLKRFTVSDDLHGLASDREAIGRKLSGGDMEIEDLLDEIEDMSDSCPEVDTMSISSNPKPSLRPFFSSSRSLLHSDSLNVPSRKVTLNGAIHLHSPNSCFNRNIGADRGLERLSDESSKKADSDSHPDSDPPPQASSPPKSSEEKKMSQQFTQPFQQLQQESVEQRERKSRLFNRDRNSQSGGKSKKHSQQNQPSVDKYDKPPISAPVHLHVHGDSNAVEQPRKVLLEQLTRVLPAEDFVPDQLFLVNTCDPLGPLLASRLQDRQLKVICTSGSADVRATISCLVNKIQKFCNSNPKTPGQIKLLLAGSDSFINSVLRHYVDQLSFKPPDWQSYIRFLVVPLGNNTICRYIGTLDGVYNSAFASDTWREILERGDSAEAASRIHRYVQQSSGQAVINLPIAEAMLTYKEKSSDDESSQIFIPFMNDVRLGSPEGSTSASVDLDEVAITSPGAPLSGSPPSSLQMSGEKKVTPPSSPNMSANIIVTNSLFRELCEPLELQLDYWLIPGSDSGGASQTKSKGDTTKSTLKSTFRSLQVARLSLSGEQPTPHFTISYSTKEKKQKIMRLGKKKEKEKDNEPRSQVVEGVSRLICSPKTQNVPLKLYIDGTEWTGVKFFQLSSHWQTHVRYFPVLLFSASDNSQL